MFSYRATALIAKVGVLKKNNNNFTNRNDILPIKEAVWNVVWILYVNNCTFLHAVRIKK